MNSPLVTISIPVYNCENHIINCLESVIKQSYSNIEILLIDDKGTDDSILLVDKFIKDHSESNFHILTNEKNLGLSVVRNRGIDNAQGKYIFFLDSDDVISPDCIENMTAVAERENVQMVCGNVRTVFLESQKEIDAFRLSPEQEKLSNNDEIFEAFVNGKIPVPSWNKLILLGFLKKNNLYFKEGIFAQDALQSFEMALVLESVYFLQDLTYIYYLHKDSVIHSRSKKHFDNWIAIAKALESHFQKEMLSKRKNQILDYLISYKELTLQMNWKAQHNEELWKYSYNAYKKIAALSILDYCNPCYSLELKKKNFLQNLPTCIGYKIFRKRFGN